MQKAASTEYLYGLNPAFECLRAGRRKIHRAYLNEATMDGGRLKKLAALLEEADVPVEPVDKGRLIQLGGTREHQGVLLKVERYPYVRQQAIFSAPRVLLLDNVEDPHNVGAILRSAEVFGFDEVLLPTKGVPEVYPSVAKVSAGAVEFLRICRDCNSPAYVTKAIEAGYRVAALDAKGDTPVAELAAAAPEKLLLVIGGEDRGVGQFILRSAHHVLAFPQSGQVNSLNASVAAGIGMYCLRSARRAEG